MPVKKFAGCALFAALVCGCARPVQLFGQGTQPAVATSPAASAEGTTPTFRSSSRLVVVDVVVADHDGNPTTGLKRKTSRS